ncbi:MAG: DUF401 family protein [Lachnospiraceae bacterium]|nr:DUF401 family protein [Lachnospiraceae bacterium]
MFILLCQNRIFFYTFKTPLWGAVLAASLLAAFVFQMAPSVFCQRAVSTILGRSCIELLLITYGLILLQELMDERCMLTKAEEGITGLSSNPKLGSVVSPVVSGLLPSPAAVLMAGSMLQKRYKGMMPDEAMAFITTYFRHIPEALLPVYTNVILMCAVTGTPEWLFLLLMLPYTFFNILVPYFMYLSPVSIGSTSQKQKEQIGGLFRKIFYNLWPILLIILLILVFRLNTTLAVYITLLLFLIQQKFSKKELVHFFKISFNKNMMLMVITILLFTDILGTAGAPNALLEAYGNIPIPLFLIYGFIVFVGSIVSNFTAMVPAIFPLAASVAHAPISLVIYLASLGHLASQLCPTHICISLCAEQFHISINDIFRKTIPVTGIMLFISTGLYFIMQLFKL